MNKEGNNHIVDKHAHMVSVLMKKGEDILKTLTPLQVDAIHCALGVTGEAGELGDAIKKWVIYCKEIDIENIVEELGDLEFFMERIRTIFAITREQTLVANMMKLAKRYEGFEYSNEAAQDRKDKEDSKVIIEREE